MKVELKLATGRRLRNYLLGQLGYQIHRDYADRKQIGQAEVSEAKLAVFDRLAELDREEPHE